MKSIIIFIIFLCSFNLRAQVPHIDYMMADESKSQLQIHGTFSTDTTGFVTIENTKQIVRSWSDTLLVCDLPDSGEGSGGHVTVTQMSGTSNIRMLSIFKMTIANPLYYVDYRSGIGYFFEAGFGKTVWNVNWRADIATRPQNISSKVRFEISKSSIGQWMLWSGRPDFPDTILHWSDSSHFSKITMTLFGELDLISFEVNFEPTQMQSSIFMTQQSSEPFIKYYLPKFLDFDTTGYLTGYQNDDITGSPSGGDYEKHTDLLYNQRILFPPAIKNTVKQSQESITDFIKILSYISSADHLISLETEVPLGEISASLYSIDGRLLKEEKINIPSAGKYLFDVNDININFGFLVLKASKGIVAKKVVFY